MKVGIYRLVVIVALAMSLSACFSRSKPLYDLTVSYDESAPTEWKLGWQHGCESGLTAFGNNYFKSIYQFKQDLSMINNEYYFKGWNDSFNYCRSVVNRSLAGDDKAQQEYPAVFSPKDLSIVPSGRRDDNVLYKTGLFGGQSKVGFMGSTFEAYTPGYGSTAWGASVPKAFKCDWLNRCGDDIPNDPMDVFMGHADPNGDIMNGSDVVNKSPFK